MARSDCRCCSGSGVVEAYTGEMRPCSRCRWADFHEWYRAMVARWREERDAERAAR